MENTRNRGQALIMVTLSLFAMMGIIGLAVDLGWSYFVRKAAQGAADAAALGAARQALEIFSTTGSFNCGGMTCTSPVPCPASGNLTNGCKYAEKNGFTQNDPQTVTMEADLGSTRQPPTAPGVITDYWVTARARETIPQLFSSILGNTKGVSGARATAAILDVTIVGALILLNRENDCINLEGTNKQSCGMNLYSGGGSKVRADQGILMASTRHGDGGYYAGKGDGSLEVYTSFAGIRGAGTFDDKNVNWSNQKWQNGLADGNYFRDPMRTIGHQPPAPPAGMPATQVDASGTCVLTGGTTLGTALKLNPGKYYCANAGQIQIQGYVQFQTGTSSTLGSQCAGGSCFGNYVFFGGIAVDSDAQITMEPGRYVFAGTKTGVSAFDATKGKVYIQDNTPLQGGNSVRNTDAGEIFIFTDPTYPGLDTTNVPASVTSQLGFGTPKLQLGNNNTVINLHGLNGSGALPADLLPFERVIFWQDQRNSVIKYYNADGTMNLDCITGVASGSQCTNTLKDPNSPNMDIHASTNLHLYGVVYQPRGAWLTMGGGNTFSGPMQVITGALALSGSVQLNLLTTQTPFKVKTIALVE